MLRDSNTLKDVLLASAIILVLVASRAEGQVRAALLTRSVPPDAEGAIMALEESREALLEAREAIDAALQRVDQTLSALGEVRPRSRALVRGPEKTIPDRLPSMDDLRTLWRSAVALYSGLEGRLLPAWGRRPAIAEKQSSSRLGLRESPPPAAGARADLASDVEPAPSTPEIQSAAFTGAAQPEAAARPPAGATIEEKLPVHILDAAGALLRALDDAAGPTPRQDPEPEGARPPPGRPAALPAAPGARPGASGERADQGPTPETASR